MEWEGKEKESELAKKEMKCKSDAVGRSMASSGP